MGSIGGIGGADDAGSLEGDVGLDGLEDVERALLDGEVGADLVVLEVPGLAGSGLAAAFFPRSRSVLLGATGGSAFFRRGAGPGMTPYVASSVGKSVRTRCIHGSCRGAGVSDRRGFRLVLKAAPSSSYLSVNKSYLIQKLGEKHLLQIFDLPPLLFLALEHPSNPRQATTYKRPIAISTL